MFADCAKAKQLLDSAYKKNPGNWKEHSENVAYSAKLIAGKVKTLDPEKAYSLGLLHDIGRINGKTGMKHVFDGYEYMIKKGFDENARICITHSFPIKNIYSYNGINDCTEIENNFSQCIYHNVIIMSMTD